ncbi:Crp/Fnr family transcriptional regulator [Crenothrix sp.]|uniref:Crp/Fnr family transcriptional regulator n=1 Tax=Crenothrix sp. TaxID=3100433 RepID=UPI00374DDF73
MKNTDVLEYQSVIASELHVFLSQKKTGSTAQIKNITFLSRLSKEALEDFLGNAKTVVYSRRELIISEGDVASAFFIIISGKVRIFSCDDKGREVTFNILNSGAFFGESALLTDNPSLVSIKTLEATICIVISKINFINWLMSYPSEATHLLSCLSLTIRQLTDKFTQMALLNVYERTVIVLMAMADDKDNLKVIYNRPSQQDLAFMVGASREMVSKIMRDLTKGGYVKVVNKALIITKTPPSSW